MKREISPCGQSLVYCLILLGTLLLPNNAHAHGEQIVAFVSSWGVLTIIALIIFLLLRIERKTKLYMIGMFILSTFLLLVIPSAKTLPLSIVRPIENLIWDYPTLAALAMIVTALIPCLMLLFIRKRVIRTRKKT
ncbi:MAG: hypothetical protein HZB30_07830 [Nitrospirae bacterium]|nr:hypothetical protein [Nitrospirota bacterium]